MIRHIYTFYSKGANPSAIARHNEMPDRAYSLAFRSLLILVFPLEQIFHSLRIVPIFDKFGQFLTGKFLALSAMHQFFCHGALVNYAFSPEDLSLLLDAALTTEFFPELTGIAIRSAFSFDDIHFTQTSSGMRIGTQITFHKRSAHIL